MNLLEWLAKYPDEDMAKNPDEGIKEFRECMNDKAIYLWGAGSVVRLYLDLFAKAGVKVKGLIDKQSHGDIVEGLEVSSPDLLTTIEDVENTIVITSVGSTLVASYIANDFEAMATKIPQIILGYRLFHTLQNMFCSRNIIENETPELYLCPMCRTFGSACPVLLKQVGAKDKTLVLSLVAYGLGTICTLKCEHCVEGIPYVPSGNRSFVSLETIEKDILTLAKACDYIVRMDFCGGEPFFHPQLNEVLQLSLSVKNIGYIHVITNGTVPPSDALCETLKDPRLKVVISDYSEQINPQQRKNLSLTVEKLREHNIAFEQRGHLVWSDMNSFEPRGLSEAQMEKAYKSCLFVNSRRLHDGVLYPCLHFFAGVQTGQLKCNADECLHIHDIPEDELPNAMHNYLERTSLSVCDRCMAPFDAPEVPAAVQVR